MRLEIRNEKHYLVYSNNNPKHIPRKGDIIRGEDREIYVVSLVCFDYIGNKIDIDVELRFKN